MTLPEQPHELSDLIDDFEDFFERSRNGYVTVSPGGAILRANSRMTAWVGYTTDDLRGMQISDLFSIGGKIYFETHLRPLLRMQAMFDEVALELVSKDGKRLPVIANAAERRDELGIPIFIRFTFFQAMHRKNYEQNLRDERSKAIEERKFLEVGLSGERETAALREQFIAVLGHDLRNPLASIDAGMRMLAKTPLDARATSIVDLVRNSTARMAGLIDNVMDFARGRLGGGIPIDRHAVQLEPVFRHVIEELQVANPEREIKSDINIPDPVTCDPGRLSQVLSNLLANAIAHGAKDGPIRVTAGQPDGGLLLSVHNTGAAIPADILPTLFEPFSRENVRASQQGLGLGLYISSEIVKAHGGTLSASSDERETCFTTNLPAPSSL